MSDMNNNKSAYDLCLAMPFFLALTVLTVVSFLLPLRPTISYSEKRELAKFPEFSVEALVSGDYFDDITLWFSDTFPGRESWMTLSNQMSSFHGYSEIAIDGDLTLSDQVPPAGEIPQQIPTPTQEQESDSPEVPEETVQAEETQAAAEEWGGVDMAAMNEISLGAVIQIGDAAFNQLGFAQLQSDRYIASLNQFTRRMTEKGVRVISAPAPTAIGIMVEPEYLEQLNCARQDEMLSYLHDGMIDDVVKVDTFSHIVKHNDEYIYFRTDHHWTALGAYYSYEAICNALGYEPAPLDSFEEWDQGDFTGSLHGKVRWPAKLTWDNLVCYIPQGDITMTAYTTNTSLGTERPLLADFTHQDKSARYSAFLSGDAALTKVVNASIPDAPKCLVVKDSFGNCLVPFLTQNYSEIYAMDYRTYRKMPLEDLVDTYQVDEIIFMPYLIATQAMDGNDFFETICK